MKQCFIESCDGCDIPVTWVNVTGGQKSILVTSVTHSFRSVTASQE